MGLTSWGILDMEESPKKRPSLSGLTSQITVISLRRQFRQVPPCVASSPLLPCSAWQLPRHLLRRSAFLSPHLHLMTSHSASWPEPSLVTSLSRSRLLWPAAAASP